MNTAVAHDCVDGWIPVSDNAVIRCPQCHPPVQPLARRSDPETSHQAAASFSEAKLNALQLFVRWCLQDAGPSTDEQLVTYIHEKYPNRPMTEQSVRTRRKELVRKGLVRDTERKAKTKTGHDSTIWEVV